MVKQIFRDRSSRKTSNCANTYWSKKKGPIKLIEMFLLELVYFVFLFVYLRWIIILSSMYGVEAAKVWTNLSSAGKESYKECDCGQLPTLRGLQFPYTSEL